MINGSSTSVKNLMHFGQLIRTEKLVEFDPEHGKRENSNSMLGMIKSQAEEIAGIATDATLYSLSKVGSAYGTTKEKLEEYGVTHKVGTLPS